MLKQVSFFLSFLLLLLSSVAAQERIKIGVSTALTGNAAILGDDIRRTLQFANEELAGGKYQFIFEDDACSGKGAASVAHKLINIDKTRYVIGFACSAAVLGAARIYEDSKVVAISPSASAATISQAGDYIFRTWPSDELAAAKLYSFIAKRHKRLGVLSELTDFSQSFLSGIRKANSNHAVTVLNEDYQTDANDYKPMLYKLKAAKIDALFINSQSEATFLQALKQVKDLNFDSQIYSAYWAGSAAFLEAAGAYGESIILVDAPSVSDVLNAEGVELLAQFKKKYGNLNFGEMLFASTFEAFRALHKAIESGEDVRNYLYTTKFHGVFGDWRFDKNGDIEGRDFVIKVVKGRKTENLQE